MASPVDICNRALAKLGEAPIIDLSQDSNAARACNGAYALVRDAVLRDHPWNFALKRTGLPALAEGPTWGFSYSYQLPSDCVKVVEVDGTQDFRIEGRQIVANQGAPLNLLYIARIEDSGLYDTLFVEALAARLAVELAERITQSPSKRDLARQEYDAALSLARRADAQEGSPSPLDETAWLDVRR